MVLEQIQPVCVAEQKFLNSFFHFEKSGRISRQVDKVLSDEDDDEPEVTSGDVGSQNLLNQLFAALLPELEEFIQFGEKQDS